MLAKEYVKRLMDQKRVEKDPSPRPAHVYGHQTYDQSTTVIQYT